MNIASAKKMLINSTYPLDKVTYLVSGSFLLPGSVSGYTIPIPHGKTYIPLLGGNWSNVSNYSIQYEFSTGIYPSSNPGVVFNTILNVFADATNVYISADNIGSSMTIYYRIFGFEPSNSLMRQAGTASQGDKFVIDSRQNYPKLFLNNFVDLPATTGSEVFIYVDHNIKTIPQAMGWVTYNTYNGVAAVQAVHPVGTSNSASQGITMIAGTDRIAFAIPPFTDAHRAYYRIYLDE